MVTSCLACGQPVERPGALCLTCRTRIAVCTFCGRQKAPRGRDVPAARSDSLCTSECPGYRLEPQPGGYWPGEPVRDPSGGGDLPGRAGRG